MHSPNHNETLDSILKFLDAQRPTAPSDATRVDQPEAYLSEGEMLAPQTSQEPWVGEAFTDILHYFGVKDPDPDVAATQKEALSGTIDFLSPQSLGGLMLMGVGNVGRVAGNVAKKLTGSAARAARAGRRKPVKYTKGGKEGYMKEYKVDSVYDDAGSKLPSFSQEPGSYSYVDNKYNYLETVTKRADGGSKHFIKIRPAGTFDKAEDLGTLTFEVQAAHPIHKGMYAYERDAVKHLTKGGDVSKFNDPAEIQAMVSLLGIKSEAQFLKLRKAVKHGTWTDEAIEMVAGKNLKQPKLIHNIMFRSTDKGGRLPAVKSLKMVFDRMDDDWIIREDLMTLDSITMMLSSVLKNYADEIEFFAKKGRNVYKSRWGGFEGKYSQATRTAKAAQEGATIAEVEAGIYDDIIKNLTGRVSGSGKMVGTPNFRAEGFDLTGRHFVMKSFKEKLAGAIGLSVPQMKEFLDSIDEKDMIGIESFQE